MSYEQPRKHQKFFISDDFEQIYYAILNELKRNPEFTPNPRGIGSREITNLSFELTNPMNRMIWNKARDTNYEFAMKFWLWMINGDTDFSYVTGVNAKAAQYDKQDAKAMPDNFSTAYGPRILKQLPAILEELRRDKDSRRAVMHILNEDDHRLLGVQTTQEYPCTDSFSWMIRDDALYMYTHMRSNNMVLTLVYDVFNMTMLHEFVWKSLKSTYPELKLGSYNTSCVSAHYFDREQELVDKILASEVSDEIGMSQKKAKPEFQLDRKPEYQPIVLKLAPTDVVPQKASEVVSGRAKPDYISKVLNAITSKA